MICPAPNGARQRNILVDDQLVPYLADFGLSILYESTIKSSKHGGSLRYEAPELLDPSRYGLERLICTPQTDVFAFANVCVEVLSLKHVPLHSLIARSVVQLFSGREPFHASRVGEVIHKVLSGQRPTRPSGRRPGSHHMPDAVWAIVQRCWAQRPQDRPNMDEVVRDLWRAL